MNHFELQQGQNVLRVTDPAYLKYKAHQKELHMHVEYKGCKSGVWWAWVDDDGKTFFAQHESSEASEPMWGDERPLNTDYGSVGVFPADTYPAQGFDAFWESADTYESFPHADGYIAALGIGPFVTHSFTLNGEVVALRVCRENAPNPTRRS